MKNNILLFLIIVAFTNCTVEHNLTYNLAPKQWLYIKRNSRHKTVGDTLTTVINKKHLFLKGFIQQEKSEKIHVGDTLIIYREKWCALGRVSPNTRQLIKRMEKFYVNNRLFYKEKRWSSLLMFDSHYNYKKKELVNGKWIKEKGNDKLDDEKIKDVIQ